MRKHIKRAVEIDGKELSFELGKIAKQANGSTVVRMGDSMVLVTACSDTEPRAGVDFLPLTVDYRENTYAGGRIPGGFFKREGRPTGKEILTCRLIDRGLRPLFRTGITARARSSRGCCRRTMTTIPTFSESAGHPWP